MNLLVILMRWGGAEYLFNSWHRRNKTCNNYNNKQCAKQTLDDGDNPKPFSRIDITITNGKLGNDTKVESCDGLTSSNRSQGIEKKLLYEHFGVATSIIL